MEPITPDEAARLDDVAELEAPPSLLDREPVLVYVLGGSLIPAGLALIAAFGVHLSADQTAAILGFVGALVTAVTAIAARRRAFAPATVAKLLEVPRPVLEAVAAAAPPRARARRRRPASPHNHGPN